MKLRGGLQGDEIIMGSAFRIPLFLEDAKEISSKRFEENGIPFLRFRAPKLCINPNPSIHETDGFTPSFMVHRFLLQNATLSSPRCTQSIMPNLCATIFFSGSGLDCPKSTRLEL